MIWILGDQLWLKQAALESSSHQDKVSVILIESLQHMK
jgi:deoxyribodipyrimidine photolyase-related protein